MAIIKCDWKNLDKVIYLTSITENWSFIGIPGIAHDFIALFANDFVDKTSLNDVVAVDVHFFRLNMTVSFVVFYFNLISGNWASGHVFCINDPLCTNSIDIYSLESLTRYNSRVYVYISIFQTIYIVLPCRYFVKTFYPLRNAKLCFLHALARTGIQI